MDIFNDIGDRISELGGTLSKVGQTVLDTLAKGSEMQGRADIARANAEVVGAREVAKFVGDFLSGEMTLKPFEDLTGIEFSKSEAYAITGVSITSGMVVGTGIGIALAPFTAGLSLVPAVLADVGLAIIPLAVGATTAIAAESGTLLYAKITHTEHPEDAPSNIEKMKLEREVHENSPIKESWNLKDISGFFQHIKDPVNGHNLIKITIITHPPGETPIKTTTLVTYEEFKRDYIYV